mmetsp:Transcript_3628/g.10879  ORF Transcript_3628/g.10879 Transcript_3628/m.10879 type:complete len:270 (-) Transcript_3628:25-834(-)
MLERDLSCLARCRPVPHSTALLFGLGASLSYVLSLYLPWCRGDRNDEKVARARMHVLAAVVSVTILSAMAISGAACIVCFGGLSDQQHTLLATAVALSVTVLPYLSTIFEYVVDGVKISELIEEERILCVRNYVFSPIVEELAFRLCCCTLFHVSLAASKPISAALSPALLFGLCHAHSLVTRLPFADEKGRVILAVAFQVGYTALFGLYVGWIYLRLRSISAALVSHAFCNFMGLPSLSSLADHPHRRLITLIFVCSMLTFAAVVTNL